MCGSKVLIVSDGAVGMNGPLWQALELAGYVVEDAQIGSETAVELDSINPDLVLMDIKTSGTDGFTVCEHIRGMSDVPIIVLAGTSDRDNKIRWWESGADIYFVKNAGLDELMARVRSAMRWAIPANDSPPIKGYWYSDAVIEIDVLRHRVNGRREPVELSSIEYGILMMLIKANGNPVAVDDLGEGAWSSESDPELVSQQITQLRHRIEMDPGRPDLIVSQGRHRYAYIAPERPGTLTLETDSQIRLQTFLAEPSPV